MMENEFRAFISNFSYLNSEEIEIIVSNTVLKEFKKGNVLLQEGAISTECYAVIRGCVREFYIKDGLEKTTAFFTEGQSVNSFSSYSNQAPSKHYLECCEDCEDCARRCTMAMMTDCAKLCGIHLVKWRQHV